MAVLELNTPLVSTNTGVTASISNDYQLRIDMLEPWLCRVAIVPQSTDWLKSTWMVSPGAAEASWQGRDRLSTDGFSCPTPSIDLERNVVSVKDDNQNALCVHVAAQPLAIDFKRIADGATSVLVQDRPMAAYRRLPGRGVFHHAQTRKLDHLHLGLGDKCGALDKTGKRFRVLQTDALGYNAETSDPLYKHVPWLIVGNNDDGYCGVFYDSFSEMNIDVGAEHSNYHEHYRHVESYDNALIYYLVDGPSLLSVVKRFQHLVGLPHFQPRWSMGFAHTSMHLADADNAQDAIIDFAEQCTQRGLPISAIHSGSGYTTKADGRRYVFTWNTSKFPQRDQFFKSLAKKGLKSCANIKPVLLQEHPLFDTVAAFDGFIKDGNGDPAIEMFWGGPGASLDFTNPDTVNWWKQGVKEQVLGAGFSSTWNDNNECEIWDESATVNGFGESQRAIDVRPIQALLMLRASYEATHELEPDKRPYLISRAGPAGIARYAQTWSGDNRTSWHTLEWNLANGLSMNLSGLPFTGHDIGGFDGPKPDAELLCRWVEMMCLHPRAVMNSWKPGETDPATTPWMHPSVEQEIIKCLRQRYRFMPWLYHKAWCAHQSGEPAIGPAMLHYQDTDCINDHTVYLVGPQVLAAPVIEPGLRERSVYLPASDGVWFYLSHEFYSALDILAASDDFVSNADYTTDSLQSLNLEQGVQAYSGGQSVTVPAALGHLPVFVRSKSVIPMAWVWHEQAPHNAEHIVLMVMVDKGAGEFTQNVMFDDGESWQYREQRASLINVKVQYDKSHIDVIVSESWTGTGRPDLSVTILGGGDRISNVRLPV